MTRITVDLDPPVHSILNLWIARNAATIGPPRRQAGRSHRRDGRDNRPVPGGHRCGVQPDPLPAGGSEGTWRTRPRLASGPAELPGGWPRAARSPPWSPDQRTVVGRRRPAEKPGLRIQCFCAPRCPRTAINSQRSPPAATCEHEGSGHASNPRSTHENTLVMRRSVDGDEDQGAEAPTVVLRAQAACPLRARSAGQRRELTATPGQPDTPAHLRTGRLTRCANRPSKQRVS